ncbi:hypothetical protein EG68_11007 [Paragonimus skrjabini miyazakii]|uniref:Uncharacterized protein n=1 Tax=Paragonimus skrjabini miyazakii TaxID=59628 RepID=A0A8S9YSR1_9TREM|nr:hypothetical protein EG68_11007 [Paragonimus skrjabini miyazakii]
MNEGVSEDLTMPAESSISDDLRKAFLQLGAPLAQQSVILDVVRKYHPEIPKDPRTIPHTPRSCRQVHWRWVVYSLWTGMGPPSSTE